MLVPRKWSGVNETSATPERDDREGRRITIENGQWMKQIKGGEVACPRAIAAAAFSYGDNVQLNCDNQYLPLLIRFSPGFTTIVGSGYSRLGFLRQVRPGMYKLARFQIPGRSISLCLALCCLLERKSPEFGPPLCQVLYFPLYVGRKSTD